MPPKQSQDSKPPREWTDSERAILREILEEREFEKQLDARKASAAATIKSIAQWVAAVIGGILLMKDSAQGAWTWFKHWITGGP